MRKIKLHIYIYGNENTPSSRLRWINYVDFFSRDKINVEIKYLKEYIQKKKVIKEIDEADVIVIQKYALTVNSLNKFKNKCKKIIFDIDDAIWMSHSNNKSFKINIINMLNKFILNRSFKYYDSIIVSNNFIGEYVNKYNSNIKIIPTSPTDRYDINKYGEEKIKLENKFIVGWTGTKENMYYIKLIEKYIKDFFIKNNRCYLLIISNDKYVSDDIEFNKKIINIKWSLENEVYYIKKFDIGIMPSTKDKWALGKAAYKLIYYIKNGIPTIATKWGYQTEFIKNEKNGLLVENNNEWEIALNKIFNNDIDITSIVKNGYDTYNELFDKKIIYMKYIELLEYELGGLNSGK